MITKTITENVLIVAAEGFWILSGSSQLKKLVRTRNRRGLFAPSQTLNAAGNIAWASYFFSKQLYVPVFTNLTLLGITTTTLAYTLGNKKQFKRGVIAIAIIGPLSSYALLKYTLFSGWIAVAYNFVATLPWLIHVIRTKKTSGISEHSLFFIYAAILSTFTYAIMITSAPLIVGTTVAAVINGIIIRYYYRYRRVR